MSMEFGWWDKTEDGKKFQVLVEIHGGNATWTRKQGHHQPWEKHDPTEAEWQHLLDEASRRVPRRLLSPKQYQAIERLRDAERL